MESLIKLVIFLIILTIGYFRGRHNERKHYEALEEEEAEVADVLIFSTRYPPPSAVPLDPVLVSGNAVISSDAFRAFVASLRKIFGGNYTSYEMLLDRGRRQALVRLKQQAKAKGANKVFNVKFESAFISDRQRKTAPEVEIYAYGTAFVVAKGSVERSRVHYKQGKALPDTESRTISSRTSLFWLIGIALVGLYAAIDPLFDVFLNDAQWRYVNDIPWPIIIPMALLCIAAAVRLSRKRKMPWLDCIIWGSVGTLVLSFSLQILVLRINSFGGNTHIVTYQLDEQKNLISPDPRFPSLNLKDRHFAFLDKPAGTSQEIQLKHGILGIWMYNVLPLRLIPIKANEENDSQPELNQPKDSKETKEETENTDDTKSEERSEQKQ